MFSTATFSKLVALVVVAVAVTQSNARPLRDHALAVRGYGDEAALYERAYDVDVSDLSLRDLESRAPTKPKSKPYVCAHCDKTFDDTVNLEKHEAEKHPNKEYKPVKSGKKRSYDDSLDARSYEDDSSGLALRSLDELLNELATRAPTKPKSKPYVCAHCDKTFDDTAKLEKHEAEKHPNKEYKPVKSGKKRSITDEAALYERAYEVDASDLALRSLDELLNELATRAPTKPKSKPYVCAHCDKTFDDTVKLEKHEADKHPNKEYKPVKSGKKRSFDDEAALYERAYDVDASDLALRDLDELLDELARRAPTKPKSKPYVCAHCDKTFDDTAKLEKHEADKHPNKEYKPVKSGKK